MLRCPRCARENADDARFCSGCGAQLDTATPPAATRKTVTVVFSDVAGTTVLGESLDPEALRDVMGRYFDTMRAVIESHGGTVEKFIGDAIMAVFGIPQLHEDDALRAVRAAAQMRTRLASLNDELAADRGVRLEVRTGVNTGDVVAGDPAAGQRLVTGDAVNVAARLEQVAAPGEILLGPETRRLVGAAVRTVPVEPLVLKGKVGRIAPFRLLEILPDAPVISRRHDAPFVGRELELRVLRDQLADCAARRECRLVTVLGAPGIGKSRLVLELVGGRSEARFVAGRCLPYGEGITYWPLAEIVKQIAGDDIGSLATLAGEEGALVADRITAVIGQTQSTAPPEETFWAVRTLLEALARKRPLIVVLDDFEWAEPTFIDLVEYVLGFSTGAAILLLAVARPELLERRPSWLTPRPNATAVVLQPLSEEDSGSLIEQLLAGAELAPDLRQRLLEAAEGNPLFVEQMLAMGAEDDLREIRVPPTIQALLAARIDGLEPDERAVIERASFEGKLFHRGAVSDLLPAQVRPQVSKHLLALVRKEFIRPDRSEFPGDDAFRFRHNLIRDAAYGGIPKEMRSDLHERFANWLEHKVGDHRRAYEEILGYHVEQAWRYRSELGRNDARTRELGRRAGELLGGAGERAVARIDMPAASNLLQRALAVLPEGHPRRNQLRLALADALFETAEAIRAGDLLTEVAASAAAQGEVTVEWRARVRHSWARVIRGEPVLQEANGLVEEAIAALTPLAADDGLAEAWQLAAQVQNYLANMDGVQAAMQRALTHARRAGNVRLETDSLFWIGLAAFFGNGLLSDALAVCTALLEAAQTPLQRAHARFWVAAIRGLAGEDIDTVRDELAEARRTYHELGLKTQWGGTAIAVGTVELHAGDPRVAEAILRESVAALGDLGGYRWTVLQLLSEALVQQGRHDEAEAVAAESRASVSLQDTYVRAGLARVQAGLAAHRGALAEAQRAAGDALALLEQVPAASYLEKADTWMLIADLLRRRGQTDDAGDAARRALELYERKGIELSAARARRFLDERRSS